MISNTIKLFIMILIYLLGLTFTLILIYSSPDSRVHLFEASLFMFAVGLIIFSVYYNLSFEYEPNSLIKYIFIILNVIFFIDIVVLALISIYANPMGSSANMPAFYIFSLSSIVVIAGLVSMLLKEGV